MNKIGDDDDRSRQLMEKEISDLEKRIEDLRVKYDRMYDDRLNGLLSDKKFREMAEKCEADQNEAEEQLKNMLNSLSRSENHAEDIERFIQTAEKYDTVNVLDKELLNRLIKTIKIGNKVQTDNGPVQEVAIDYRINCE